MTTSDGNEITLDQLREIIARHGAWRRGEADGVRADLSGANLRDADLSGANLRGANVPVVPGLHRQMLAAIGAGGELDMGNWHSCDTTHCRAGWTIHLAGEAGYALEKAVGPNVAGALISLASCDYLERVPNFYASAEDALADIRACAERELAIAE
ncbi:MAG: pentapeptide repeat-containing protein [Candidatus Kapaibacterium sp.]